MIENPHGSITVIREKNVTVRKPGEQLKAKEIVQIQPQKISLTLRSGGRKWLRRDVPPEWTGPGVNQLLCAGEPQTFKLKFKRAEDYPIDLYYLMDLSYSMEDDLENVKKLGTTLMEKMSKITSDFQIGEDVTGV